MNKKTTIALIVIVGLGIIAGVGYLIHHFTTGAMSMKINPVAGALL